VGVNPQRLMMSFVEDDRSTSPASAHNATLAVGGDSAWRTGALGLLAAATSIVTVGGNLIVVGDVTRSRLLTRCQA